MSDVKATMQQLRPAIDAALAQIAKDFGLAELHLGSGKYDPRGSFTFKLEGVMSGGLTREAIMYNEMRGLDGLPPLGTKFKGRDGQYEISGMNSTGTKVLAKREQDGKQFWWRTPGLKAALAAQGVRA